MEPEQKVLLTLGLLLITGCAGYKAMVIERPPVPEPCGILVCEHWGPGKVQPEDCKCSRKQSVEDILR